MEFAKRLKDLRIKHGLTQDAMAKLLGMTNQNYGRFETQNANPKMATLIKLAQIFGVSVDYLLGNDEMAAETEEGRQAASAYWSKLLAPEFKVEYRENYFYLTALQDMALPLNDMRAGSDYKMNCYEFNNIIRNIENSVQRTIEKERKETALEFFKMAISLDAFAPFAFTAIQSGESTEKVKEKLKELLYKLRNRNTHSADAE